MLGCFPVSIAVGTALGFLSGLGIGGGSLLILWLTMILGLDYGTARGINLLFFLPAAVVAILLRRKQGCVPWKQLFPGIAAGCAAAMAGAFLSTHIDLALLKKLFGCLLLLTGLRELFYKPKSEA